MFWSATGLYVVGWLLTLAAALFDRKGWGRFAVASLVAGFVAQTLSILVRWAVTGHGPVVRDFENATAGSWAIMLVTVLLLRGGHERRSIAIATTPVALGLLGFGLSRSPALEPLSPTLKTPWLVVHVAFAWVAFGTLCAASGAAAVFLVKDLSGRSTPEALAALDELQFRLVAYGFVAWAAMLASGAIWARLLWGTYWAWDPVETWSLVTWLLYGFYIHMRVVFGWKLRKAAVVALVGVIPVFISFWGVGLIMRSRHIFALMDLVAQ